MGVQNSNFTRKILQNGGFLAPNLAFLDDNFIIIILYYAIRQHMTNDKR